jgi:hypothetical protein
LPAAFSICWSKELKIVAERYKNTTDYDDALVGRGRLNGWKTYLALIRELYLCLTRVDTKMGVHVQIHIRQFND